ncbi:MAG: hypothetical protein JRH11_24670 [Deltaproteobacteria bacterium]|nr:hypothetical protein [Deltaproteobacteria bacterium]
MRLASTLSLVLLTAPFALACGGGTAAAGDSSARETTPGASDSEAPPAYLAGEDEGAAPIGIAHEHRLADGLTTGGMPDQAVLEAARDRGITTVISLRTLEEPGAAEEGALVEELGMTFVSIPVAGAEGITEANARLVRDAVGDDAAGTLLHCGSSNRVGALLALGAFFIDGASKDDAMTLGREAGLMSLEETTASVIDAH